METAPQDLRASAEDGLEVLRFALPERPEVTWSISVMFINGEPYFRRIEYRATDPHQHPVAMSPKGGIPWARLIGVWCVFHNQRPDGEPYSQAIDLWAAWSRPPRNLSRAPQQTKGITDEEQHRRMTSWSEPVAEVMLAAHSAGEPLRQAVADRFGFSVDRAKQVMEIARRYHPYLPKRKTTPGSPEPGGRYVTEKEKQ